MHRELFTIPGTGITIYSYGLLLVIGAVSAIWLTKILARRKGINPELFVNAGLLALVAGVLGARISHVLENWSIYTRPGVGFWGLLAEAANIRSGGLTYYGGFLLAFPVLVIYGRIKKVNIRVGMDIIAPALMVGLAFGRLGCFANGCCYGREWDGACAVHFPYASDVYVQQVEDGKLEPPRELLTPTAKGGLRLLTADEARRDPETARIAAQKAALGVHPTQIYSAITAFLIAGLLLAFTPFSRTPGHVFALMLLIEPVTRFIIELLRVEPALETLKEHFGVSMSLSMALAIPQILVGIVLWVAFWIMRQREQSKCSGGASPASTIGKPA